MNKNSLGTYQFDIKETIKLSQQQIPIEEIEEMEIVPNVEIEQRGEEIEITGSLYVYGSYRGNNENKILSETNDLPHSYEESVQFTPLSADRGPFSPLTKEDKLEHRIPVKITLPSGKVRDVSDVYAYINSFDYDLMSQHQIEIIASLIIGGFVEKEDEMKKKTILEEQLEFVHIAGGTGESKQEPTLEERLAAIEDQVPKIAEPTPAEEERIQLSSEKIEQVQAMEAMENERPIAPIEKEVKVEAAPEVRDEPKVSAIEVRNELEANAESEVSEEPEIADTPEIKAEEKAEEKGERQEEEENDLESRTPLDNVIALPNLGQAPEENVEVISEMEEDIRVAITGKGTKQDREEITSLSSIFSRRPVREEVEQTPNLERSEDAAEDEEEKEEHLYLTNFMESNQEQFTKLKLCIVQKDETIEEIAERYRIQAESILRANQAVRTQISQGQILYIPVKG
ncbi:LysM peptidoglycan-binding domain-containing protein [Ammoniphilus resinae]|uniref:Stage VI sporulation protein D n=1 Tax=Ammoniphilus resinae TaxID=861532 RepID=A0ABS4GJG4_9BACL|nr:LysM peptidoglycan-binding domain-containing protein [Ammoniphilus resinae]MBP1930395.1 stage VI sporulation protein D [Ammoniphilus resinae]